MLKSGVLFIFITQKTKKKCLYEGAKLIAWSIT